MARRGSLAVVVGALVVAGAGIWSAEEAKGQGGYYSGHSFYGPAYYGPSYGGRSFHFGFSPAPRYSYYQPYDYGFRPLYRAPRRLEYDLYTPYGRSEVNYRFRRDGSVRVDIDD